MSIHFTYRVALLVVTLLLGWSAEASAASGVVRGHIQFWQKQGGYCPAGRDCTGSNYRESDFDTVQPVAEVQIQLVDAANLSRVLGQGTTDASGNYLMSWTTPSTPPPAKILWKARQKDARFEIVSASSGGIRFFNSSGSFPLTPGTSLGSPQLLSTFTWGNSASPNAVANLYDGGRRMWHYALSHSQLMQSRFTGVKVRAFDDTTCPSSCGDGVEKEITIDSTASAFRPLTRIMHEMGHIASYLSKPFLSPDAYNYPYEECPGDDCGWMFQNSEWLSTAFEEGLATFLGVVANYSHNAPNPTVCGSTSFCNLSVEASSGPVSSCATDEDRWPISTVRFLWDIYDSIDDPNYHDVIGVNYDRFFTTLNGYPNGFGDGQIDEPWEDATYSTIDNRDGRNQRDFFNNLRSTHGVTASLQLAANCVP